ncbi:MAG: tRNA (adenosine(37)-N6)-threonylcarbamoyltransferase complex dimerization subunit type 1 TsaB, partial [Fimbriimonadaceae bacterium]|nr:tRNA (adenosine(37)-N6)-threonylcarbamoyltransferase complex dimerization subunit type 1 TsaB [Alphaproteobacteria bacterium]
SRGQAEELVPMIARVMAAAELSFGDIDRIALTIGPGTFTGLRTGLATARGLGLASGKPVTGVGTLRALAWDFASDFHRPDDLSGPFGIVIDARRGQVYMQLFNSPVDCLGDPDVYSIADAVARLPEGHIHLAGSGARLLHAAAKNRQSDFEIRALPDETGPSPLAIAAIAASMTADSCPPSLLYLRPPDAKPQAHVPLARQ